jgi:hypothetical protein
VAHEAGDARDERERVFFVLKTELDLGEALDLVENPLLDASVTDEIEVLENQLDDLVGEGVACGVDF